MGWRQRGGARRVREGRKKDPFPVPFFWRAVHGNRKTGTKKRDSFQVQKMDLKMGPFFGFTKGIFIKVRKTDPFLGPFSGPKNCPVFWPRFFDFRVRWDPVLDGGGVQFWSLGGASLGRTRRGPKGPTRGQFWNTLRARYRCAGGACAWHLFWTCGLSCAGWRASCLPFRQLLFV